MTWSHTNYAPVTVKFNWRAAYSVGRKKYSKDTDRRRLTNYRYPLVDVTLTMRPPSKPVSVIDRLDS